MSQPQPLMVPFEKYDALVQLVAQMKREGFAVPGDTTQMVVQPDLPLAIRQAIAALAEPPSALHRTLVNRAWEMVNAGLDAETVVARIQTGEPADL